MEPRHLDEQNCQAEMKALVSGLKECRSLTLLECRAKIAPLKEALKGCKAVPEAVKLTVKDCMAECKQTFDTCMQS